MVLYEKHSNLNLAVAWDQQDIGDIKVWTALLKQRKRERESREWSDNIKQKSKLKLYRVLKTELVREQYLDFDCPRYNKTLVTQFKSGNTNLRVELGRRRNEKREERICQICLTGAVEDESHILLNCYVYDHLREKLKYTLRQLAPLGLSKTNDDTLSVPTLLGGERVQAKDKLIVFRSVGLYLAKVMALRKEMLNVVFKI